MATDLQDCHRTPLDEFVRVTIAVPPGLVRAVVRIMESDIFPEGFSDKTSNQLADGAQLAWAQLRRESAAYSSWACRRRAFILGGDAYDRLTLEDLRNNEAGIASALRTLAEVELILRSCEAAHQRSALHAA